MSMAWFDDPYLESLTDQHATSCTWRGAASRWGHSMHTMCSYHGMFPARLVHQFVHTYTEPGQIVFDPFSGRGTTVLQARVEGRYAYGGDLSPLAFVLSKAKAQPPSWEQVMDAVDILEQRYRGSRPVDPQISEDIRMLFHPETLRQICFLRMQLRSPSDRWTPEQFMIAGSIAGILHGGTRKDGSSSYLSVSMPNTFSMAPGYVRRYIDDNGLEPPEQDVFDRLREKLARLYLDDPAGARANVALVDAIEAPAHASLAGRVDLLLTSPPYLKVVNYGQSNWIRLWWLGLDDVSRQRGTGRRTLDASLDHAHSYNDYANFMARVWRSTASALTKDGVAVYVIGDVADGSGGSVAVPLAQKVWDDVGDGTGLRLIDVIEDHLPVERKVSRIWGESRGEATTIDRLLILGRADGAARSPRGAPTWLEPYKDAGPDAAHALLNKQRKLRM
jgi:hypothetical protein